MEMGRNNSKSWRRDEYIDRHSNTVKAVEIIPINDLRQHISDEKCECLPELSTGTSALMLIHNAFDGREFDEPNNTERGN